ncbi:hypothetical protein [Pseudalkalibacillus berkeleyi]|uniref:DUF4871 domain-containing protein n=1 Tax=Pseudalkalibacillus berkeleyi TaxID=1069813 RepID=A0ABS9H5L6_9BACL|nr:hypothetical protein [Pseudalkalibacillus berkeleyi]MCF6139173.1 hypothetical protein [Pseudalkalibacillus berkeleyi]
MKIRLFVFCSLIVMLIGCTSEEVVEEKMILPENTPDFVKESDIDAISWDNKAVEFGRRYMIGNENKTGIIGADMPSLNGQKWMWHLWDVPSQVELTVVGYHKETDSVHQVLYESERKTHYWSKEMAGPNNGADAHMPSNVKFPESGEWAFLVYADGELYDIVVMEVS